MDKTKVSISEILKLKARLKEINSLDMSEVEFVDDNGEKVYIEQHIKDDYRFTGLNLSDFIATGFYQTGFDQE